jgi:hypothetical protein
MNEPTPQPADSQDSQPSPLDYAGGKVPADPNVPIVARHGTYYRNTRYILALILFAMAAWFAYDGWIGWPRQNEQFRQLKAEIDRLELAGQDAVSQKEQLREIKEHSDLDLLAQRVLAITLPVLGIALAWWAVHNSRGQIRLIGDRLSAPGHPEITLDDIEALDQRLWDRKDIAYVRYEKGAQTGSIRLDAFVYQAEPIVQIYERIEAFMKEDADSEAGSQAES